MEKQYRKGQFVKGIKHQRRIDGKILKKMPTCRFGCGYAIRDYIAINNHHKVCQKAVRKPEQYFSSDITHCPNCFKLLSQLQCKHCKGRFYLCNCNQHQCIQESKFLLNPYHKWIASSKITNSSWGLFRLPFLKEKNNIAEEIQKKKLIYTNKLQIDADVPDFLFNYATNPAQAKIILENREKQFYLPLEIKDSSIPNAGLGVFATRRIPADRLICSYLGQLRFTQFAGGDSVMTLGFVQKKPSSPIQSLSIACQHYCNVARFINATKQFNDPLRNCLSKHYPLRSSSLSEDAILIYSERVIEAGQQLLYSYGNDYFQEQGKEVKIGEDQKEQKLDVIKKKVKIDEIERENRLKARQAARQAAIQEYLRTIEQNKKAKEAHQEAQVNEAEQIEQIEEIEAQRLDE